MANYKDKYEMLLESVNQIGTEPLKEIAQSIEKMVADPVEQEPSVTQEQFNAMGYTERVKFKAEHPEFYEKYKGGN